MEKKARGGWRPNSGRKSLTDEQKVANAMARCLDVAMEFVNSDAPLKERAEVAVKLVAKSITQTIELSGKNGQAIEVISYEREDIARRDPLRATAVPA